jgi:hypothetical protein
MHCLSLSRGNPDHRRLGDGYATVEAGYGSDDDGAHSARNERPQLEKMMTSLQVRFDNLSDLRRIMHGEKPQSASTAVECGLFPHGRCG